MTSIQAIVSVHILLSTSLAYQSSENSDYLGSSSNNRRHITSDEFVREDTRRSNNPLIFPMRPNDEGNLPSKLPQNIDKFNLGPGVGILTTNAGEIWSVHSSHNLPQSPNPIHPQRNQNSPSGTINAKVVDDDTSSNSKFTSSGEISNRPRPVPSLSHLFPDGSFSGSLPSANENHHGSHFSYGDRPAVRPLNPNINRKPDRAPFRNGDSPSSRPSNPNINRKTESATLSNSDTSVIRPYNPNSNQKSDGSQFSTANRPVSRPPNTNIKQKTGGSRFSSGDRHVVRPSKTNINKTPAETFTKDSNPSNVHQPGSFSSNGGNLNDPVVFPNTDLFSNHGSSGQFPPGSSFNTFIDGSSHISPINPNLSSRPTGSGFSNTSPLNPNINRRPTKPNINRRPSLFSNLNPQPNQRLPASSFSFNSQDEFPNNPPFKPGFFHSPGTFVGNSQPPKSPSNRPVSSGIDFSHHTSFKPNKGSFSSQSFSKSPLTSIAADQFSLDLLRSQSSKDNRANIVMSPISITSLLSMLLFASKGNTENELRSALYMNNISDTEVQEFFRNILRTFVKSQDGVLVQMGSRLYIQHDHSLVPNYVDLISTVYDATIEKVDFVNNPVEIMNAVNNWVNQLTQGHISNLVGSPFSPTTIVTAVNAIYFNGDWTYPFLDLFTQLGIFQSGFKNISIPLMVTNMNTYFLRNENEGISMVALPYKGNHYAMYIITHDGPPGSIDMVQNALTPNILNEMINNMVKTSVWVTLPRMKLKNRMYLKEDLRSSHVHSVFTPTLADLSGMTQQRGAFVSDIIHEAVMEITETGTAAAAASGVSTDRATVDHRIIVTKPSLIFIRNVLSGETLFMVKVVDPEPIIY